nr:MAG TPA: hypothetical protein [Caudoviricetes sp.]DAY21805.1 MAG TPA: hypothetical protein [Caudoviricetes sp.]
MIFFIFAFLEFAGVKEQIRKKIISLAYNVKNE